MNTAKNLFASIVDFANLLHAAKLAAQGKTEQPSVLAFFNRREENLLQLQKELIESSYHPGNYETFFIYDPKPRLISAAPFRDRVVHHALMAAIAPILERSLIYDTYANRVGKGTHAAILRYQHFLRHHAFVLKCDIKKFFPSIDHDILKQLLRKRIGDKRTLWLIDLIIDNSNKQIDVIDYFPGDDLFTPIERRRGLPIGNLTSQYFANYYLSPFDHFVKETLRCLAYVRYVDDFVLFAQGKTQLHEWLCAIRGELPKYRLVLNERQSCIYQARSGRSFLGQVVFPTHRRLRGENVRRFKKRLRHWQQHPSENAEQCIAAWLGHARQANTAALTKKLGI